MPAQTPSTTSQHAPKDSFTILPSTPPDIPSLRAVGNRAFGPASFQGHIFPPSRAHLTPPEELTVWRCNKLRRLLEKGEIRHFKLVATSEGEEGDGKIVGYSGWYAPGHFAKGKGLAESMSGKGKGSAQDDAPKPAAVGGEGEEGEERKKAEEDFPACMDVDVQKECTAILDRERKKIWGEDANFWYVGALAIDPDYQGLGLSRKLVEHGLEWADRDGVPTYLEATPEGAKIYPRFGFEKVGEYGFFDGEHVCEFQIRQPGASVLKTRGAGSGAETA